LFWKEILRTQKKPKKQILADRIKITWHFRISGGLALSSRRIRDPAA
jgi:hypothetical protein